MPPDVAVSDLLLEWEEREVAGRPVTPEELCRSRPELLGELRRCIDLLRFVSPLFDLDGAKADGATFPSVPGFEILDRLGEGGMGVVYRARDTALERVVAIKMPHVGVLTGDMARSRFEREARVLAQLRHPNIVPVHAAGLADGRPYFVMDYVPQGSLAGQTPRLTGRVEAVTHIIEKVARAVQHAHEQGILHRDLKPSNILLDERRQPLVADFGLAKIAGAEDRGETTTPPGRADAPPVALESQTTVPQLTLPGAQPGTPAYMAPEQFDPAQGAVGPATDVWALGVILYELLTGRKPFRGGSRRELSAAVCRAAPPRPRSLRRSLDRRLETVVLRCLEKEPAKRFASARELADALARWGPRRRRARGAAVAVLAALLALAAYGVAAREMSPERRYERQVAPLLQRLERGEAVDLILPGGATPPHRIRCVEGATKACMTDEGFVVTSPTLGIVELLPRVPGASYRIEAELRHEISPAPSQTQSWVGLTLAHRHFESPAGVHHVIADVAFDDWKVWPLKVGDHARPACVAGLQLRWFLDAPPDGETTYGKQIDQRHDIFYSPVENLAARRPWRSLVVHVGPERITAFWGDDPPTRMRPLTGADDSRFVRLLRESQPQLREVELEPLGERRVGVMVEGGRCTVRRLRVVPLSPAD
jgi:serine/threonine-protein kinase